MGPSALLVREAAHSSSPPPSPRPLRQASHTSEPSVMRVYYQVEERQGNGT